MFAVISSNSPSAKNQVGLPPWVMTFADLMSLLLAFFVLLFSFSEMDKNVYKMLAGSLRDAFGVQREIRANEAPRGINIIATEFSPGRPTRTPFNVIQQQTTDDYHMHPVFTDPSEEGLESKDKKTEEVKDKAYNASIDDQKADNTGEPGYSGTNEKKVYMEGEEHGLNKEKTEQALRDPVAADTDKNMTDQAREDAAKNLSNEILKALEKEIMAGLIDLEVKDKKIILRIREKGSFPSGSADMIEPFEAITERISQVFSDFDGIIIVSGHTDNVPIHTDRFRSNWELSSSRAVSVILALSKNKSLNKKRFQLAAYGDTQPVDTNNTASGRANNRRVEISLDYSNLSDDIRKAASANLEDGSADKASREISPPISIDSRTSDGAEKVDVNSQRAR